MHYKIIMLVVIMMLLFVDPVYAYISDPIENIGFKVVIIDCDIEFYDVDVVNHNGLMFFNGWNLKYVINGTCVYPTIIDFYMDHLLFEDIDVYYYGFYFQGFNKNICVLNMRFEL